MVIVQAEKHHDASAPSSGYIAELTRRECSLLWRGTIPYWDFVTYSVW